MKSITIIFVFLMLAAACCSSQQAPPTVRVEISTDKKDYVWGDKIKFRVLLINEGHEGLYISKQFWQAGGGIAGFYVSVKQLSGKRSNVANCEGFGDGTPDTGLRSLSKY